MSNIKVVGLFIYPIKSAGGIAVDTLDILSDGPKWDRHWMLSEADGTFISQRTDPSLCKIQPTLTETTLRVSAPGWPDLEVPLAPPPEVEVLDLQIHNQKAQGRWVSKECDQWFSKYLGRPVRFVAPKTSAPRKSPRKYDIHETPLKFADAFPFLLTSTESLEDLNTKLETPVAMDRFRPNIVVKGGEAYAEDQWFTFHIGTIPFAGVKDCSRCVMVTVDQVTGLKNPKVMSTLSGYRKKNNKIVFGKNLSHQALGEIKIGMALEFDS